VPRTPLVPLHSDFDRFPDYLFRPEALRGKSGLDPKLPFVAALSVNVARRRTLHRLMIISDPEENTGPADSIRLCGKGQRARS
jgi:hypothetical protein